MRMNDASTRLLVLANLGTPRRRPRKPCPPTRRIPHRSARGAVAALVVATVAAAGDPAAAQPGGGGKYASIWMREGSPLAVHTRRLAQAVQDRLPQWKVVHAMRYGAPSLADALRNGIAAGAREIRVLPLYPQYSTTTTASVADAIAGIDAGDARIAMLDDYHAHPA